MGIKNLLKFLSNYDNILKKVEDDNNYKGEKIAIDISIILYKVVIAIRNSGADLTNKKGEVVSHILGLFNKTIYLLKKILYQFMFLMVRRLN
jgi:flap endonuclease-1